MPKPSKYSLFIKIAKPDSDGFSRAVSIEEFVGEYGPLLMGNGGDWCRDDGRLGKEFNVERQKKKGKIVAVKLNGYQKNPIAKLIPNPIKQAIRKQKCKVLAIGNVEVDHKDGRRDDPRLSDPQKVTLADFQPLSKAVNLAKRQHCRRCRETNKRFDAKQLGYAVSQFKGNGMYRGTCVGCYWHDPHRFNKEVTNK